MEYDWQEHFLQSIGEAEKEGKPVLIMLAGINGAGKSTFYKHYLEETGYEFINADALHKEQRGCHATTSEQGFETARKVDGLINNRLSLNHSFIHETLFSDIKGYKLDELKKARDANYLVLLLHVTLSTADLALERVEKRVGEGGHDVERGKISARFDRIPKNIEAAKSVADIVYEFNNDDPDNSYEITYVFSGNNYINLPL